MHTNKSFFWASHIARNAPSLALRGAAAALAARTIAPPSPRKILVGTHHKALTVYLARVFRVWARLTARSYDLGSGGALDYSKDVIIDHHSRFVFDRLAGDWIGLHVVRDPRDIVVSGAKYHLHSREEWLHQPRPEFGGQTYQQATNAIASDEDRLIFEIENECGRDIAEIASWDFSRPQFLELRYEDLVGDGAIEHFAAATRAWNLPAREHDLLVALFRYFALGEPGASGNRHIRNAASGQWRASFTPKVIDAFRARLPDAAEKLGYGW